MPEHCLKFLKVEIIIGISDVGSEVNSRMSSAKRERHNSWEPICIPWRGAVNVRYLEKGFDCEIKEERREGATLACSLVEEEFVGEGARHAQPGRRRSIHRLN